MAAFIVMEATVYGQEKKKQFEVFHNGEKVGGMIISKTDYGQLSELKMEVAADLKLVLFKIHIDGKEEAIFENGILNYSSVLRKANGKIKTNRQTKREGKNYLAYDGLAAKAIGNSDIRHNLLSIIFNQPISGQSVFVDNLQEAHQIRQISPNVFRVMLKDGNYNQYTYHNGECAVIELNTSMLKLVIKKV